MIDLVYKTINGTSYQEETDAEVMNILERARSQQERVRLFYGNTTTGECWMDENDTIGCIGRSTGSVKIPLLIPNTRSTGGGGLLDNCIIRIDGNDRGKIYTKYAHPLFHFKTLAISSSEMPGYAAEVLEYGRVSARFKSMDKASRFVKFMKGERWSK
jgi:hypothetical protein